MGLIRIANTNNTVYGSYFMPSFGNWLGNVDRGFCGKFNEPLALGWLSASNFGWLGVTKRDRVANANKTNQIRVKHA